MAAEYFATDGLVSLNSPIIFNNASIPCTRGYVYHEDGTGIFILRGIVNNDCAKYATYQINYSGNIAIPEGGTTGDIATAITVNGEPRTMSRSISTPTVANSYDSVYSTAIIKVPRGCCFSVSVEYVSGLVDDTTGTPAPSISQVDGNLTITRIA